MHGKASVAPGDEEEKENEVSDLVVNFMESSENEVY